MPALNILRKCWDSREKASSEVRKLSHASMLSGFGTLMRAAISDSLNTAMNPARSATSAGLDAIAGLTGRSRTRYAAEVPYEMLGMWKSMPSYFRSMSSASRAVRELDEIYGEGSSDWYHKALEVPFKIMSGIDTYFYGRAFHGSIYKQAARKAASEGLSGAKLARRVEGLIEEQAAIARKIEDIDLGLAKYTEKTKKGIRLSAEEKAARSKLIAKQKELVKGSFAEEAALTGDRTVFTARETKPWKDPATGEIRYQTANFDSIINGLDDIARQSILIDAVLPFRRTPANVVRETLRGSPVGAIWAVQKAMQGKAAGLPDEIIRAHLMDDLGKALTGTSVMYTLLYAADKGLIEVNPYKKAAPAERATEDAAGMQSDTLRVGDWTVPVARLEPFGAYLLQAGRVAEMLRNGEIDNNAIDTTFQMMQTLVTEGLGETFLDPFAEFSEALQDDKKLDKYMQSLGARFIPRVVTQFDQTVKEPPEGGGFFQGLKSKTPGLGEEAKLGLFGEEKTAQAPIASLLFGRTGKIGNDPLAQEMVRVGAYHLPPQGLDKASQNKLGITKEEDRTHRKALGRVQRMLVQRLVDHPQWAQIPDDRKKEAIDDAYRQASRKVNSRVRGLKRAGMPLTERNIFSGL